MRTVVIESPLAGDYERNHAYACLAMLDCLRRGEAPFASHLLYPQVLDDLDAADRKLGMQAGLALGAKLDAAVVYTDLGISSGVKAAITRHTREGMEIEYRQIENFERKLARFMKSGRDKPTTDDTLAHDLARSLAQRPAPPAGARNVAVIKVNDVDVEHSVEDITAVTAEEVTALQAKVDAEIERQTVPPVTTIESVDPDFDEPPPRPFRLGSK